MINTEQQFLERYTYHYENDVLGKGGFGEVFKAYDNVLGRYFAVKIANHITQGNKTFSLIDEFKALENLPDHSNIAKYEQLFTFTTHRGKVDYALMQYYPDGNLSQLIKKQKLSLQQKEDLALQLLDGIGYLHQHQVVHRDLKPSNILVQQHPITKAFIPKITDFGLSKKANTEINSQFSNTNAAFTYAYCSPEQILGENLRFNTDLWAYGVIVYEIFTGKTMFNVVKQGTGSSAMVLQNIINMIMKSDISNKIAELPTQWQNVVKACLVRDAQQRVKTAQDLQNILAGNTTFTFKESTNSTDKPEQPIDTNTVINPNTNQDNTTYQQSNAYGSSPPPSEGAGGRSKGAGGSTNFFQKNKKPILIGCGSLIALPIIGLAILFLIGMFAGDDAKTPDLEVVLTPFSENNLYGYKQGDSLVITPSYTTAEAFTDGKAKVSRNDSVFYIDPQGKMVEFIGLATALADTQSPTATDIKPVEPTPKTDPNITPIKVEENQTEIQTKTINGMKMIKIPGKNFYMSETEVTRAQFERFINATGYETTAEKEGTSYVFDGSSWVEKSGVNWRHNVGGNGNQPSSHPVIHVSWHDAVAYCKFEGVRLPTETEWEYAAKGGQNYEYAGSNNLDAVGWYWDNNSGSKTHPVKGKKPNGYGLYDMSGNVWEWTATVDGSGRVLRGGSWSDNAGSCPVARRSNNVPGYRDRSSGFRVLSL